MSHIHFPDPSHDKLAELINALISSPEPFYQRDLMRAYDILCSSGPDEDCGGVLLDREDRHAVQKLATEFRRHVLRDAQQDSLLNPELVPMRIPLLEARVLSEGINPRYAFYTEITNHAGEWLIHADSQIFHFSSGPAAMRICTPSDPDYTHEYDILLSPPAFQEDLHRLQEAVLPLLYKKPSSFLLLKIKQAVAAAEAEFVSNEPQIVSIETDVINPKTAFKVETSHNCFVVTAHHSQKYLTLSVTISPFQAEPCAPIHIRHNPASASQSLCKFDLKKIESAYFSTCWKHPRVVALRLPLGNAEHALFAKLQNSATSSLFKRRSAPMPVKVIMAVPRVLESAKKRKDYSAIIYCVDSSGRTLFVENDRSFVFHSGPVAYNALLPKGKVAHMVLQPIYSPEAFREELAFLTEQGTRIMANPKHLSYLLDYALVLVANAEGRSKPLNDQTVKYITVKQGKKKSRIMIETVRSRHWVVVELEEPSLTPRLRLK